MGLHFSKEEFSNRKEKTLNSMKNEGVDALIMFRQESMYWLTGYDTFGYVFFQALVLDQKGNVILLTRAPDLRQAQNTSNISDIRIWVDKDGANPADDLKIILDELNLKGKKIGVEYEAYGLTGRNALRLNTVLQNYCSIEDKSELITKLRVIKSDEEISVMKSAALLASNAHKEAIMNTHPGIGEWEIQSIIEAHFTSNKSTPSYGSIVGGGDNGTILHYHSNNMEINDGELVLVDAGCEISGYASDITRTWPVNGKFSDPQREIYELVLKAEKAAIEACVVGSPWSSMHHASSRVLAQGLIDLGVLNCDIEEALGTNFDGPFRNFFMHGTGHMLGLDVHDVGAYRMGDYEVPLQNGMILTVEPGIYISDRIPVPEGQPPIDEKWKGIGIRIEDDVLVTDTNPDILSIAALKEISDLEF